MKTKKRSRYDGLTPEQIREATEHARRMARYGHARERIRKIVDGAPPLTQEQRSSLALLLTGSAVLDEEDVTG